MRRNNECLTAFAPAKVNLFLNIIGRNEAGYHLLESLFMLLHGLHDEVIVMPAEDLTVEFTNWPSTHPLAQNIVLKAAILLKQQFTIHQGAHIKIHKNIPVAAGLGGGSSDVATVLLLLVKLWRIDCTKAELAALALQIGADVPFFVYGFNALVEGVGEIITPVNLNMEGKYILLINPQVSSLTAQVFQQYKQTAASFSPSCSEKIPVMSMWKNDLQAPACRINPVIANLLKMLQQAEGVELTSMSGSGASCFAIFSSEQLLQEAYNWLYKRQPQWFMYADKLWV